MVLHMVTPEQRTRSLAAVITKALADREISHRAAANATGIPLSTLSRRLMGVSPFTVPELHAVGDLVGRDPVRLLLEAEQTAA